jgi:hypothetical protein
MRTCSTWFHTQSEQHTSMVCVKIIFPYSDHCRSNEFARLRYAMDFVFWIELESQHILYITQVMETWKGWVDCGTTN